MTSGRPTIMTPEKLDKLREGFMMGFSDEEACAYADIGKSTLYNYQNENKEYLEQKEAWKQNPILKAKTNIISALNEKDREISKWYLERKKKEEFSTKSESDIKISELKGLVGLETTNEKES